jgi:predicted RNA-binding Zn-ribbon protein involved in translation (DUF1610 family)
MSGAVTRLACPHCGRVGKSSKAVTAGAKVKCPFCRQIFSHAPSEPGSAALPKQGYPPLTDDHDRIALLGALKQPSVGPAPTDTAVCPYCGEPILAIARKCKHCGEFLDADLRAQRAAAASPGLPTIVSRAPVTRGASTPVPSPDKSASERERSDRIGWWALLGLCVCILGFMLFRTYGHLGGPRLGQRRTLLTGITYFNHVSSALEYARERRVGARPKETGFLDIPPGATLVVLEALQNDGVAKVKIVEHTRVTDIERLTSVLRVQGSGLWIYWPDTN